jgi:hypothetical protein
MIEIVIAILLALILVALVSGNKDAASSVGKTIRIGLFLLLIAISWFILIGYSVFYYFSYTDQDWYSALGIAVPIVLPLLYAWVGKNEIKELFKKDNKSIFKILFYILLGVIGWVTLSILFQEMKKTDPNLGWTILIYGVIISGSVILNRCLNKGWKNALTFKLSPWDQVVQNYDELQAEENKRWAKFSESWTGDKDDYEYKDLMEEHFKKYDALDRECNEALEKVRGVKKKEDWWLFAFYFFITFIGFGLLGYVWDYVFDWVMTLTYVKGREWVAYLTIIGVPLLVIGGVMGTIDEYKKKKKQVL